MKELDFDSQQPIYIQISEWLEDKIISGQLQDDEQIPSTTELSASLKINPATVLKGMNLLADKKIIYKKRGLGMFVSQGAAWQLKEERKSDFFDNYVKAMLTEAERIGFTKEDIIGLINSADKLMKERNE